MPLSTMDSDKNFFKPLLSLPSTSDVAAANASVVSVNF